MGKHEWGLLLRYSGPDYWPVVSVADVTAVTLPDGTAHREPATRSLFARRYTREEALLLSETEALRQTLSWLAIREILEQKMEGVWDPRYGR